jgi:hypothetical protein
MKFVATIASSLLVLLVGLREARADDDKPKPITVPFELLKTQHMTVQVRINGKGPYRVIFDTGAPATLINNKVAKETGVLPKDFRPPLFAFFGSMGQFKMKSLEVGDAKIENANTMVMDHPTVAAISNALGPIEGIVGFNFFAKYKMTIDYQAKVMTFVPTNYQPKDMLDNLMKILMDGQKQQSKVLAPGGLVGIKVDKGETDNEPGVIVKTVFADSPAARAGFKEGDRLLVLDDRWTDTPTDCYAAAARISAGSSVHAVVARDGKKMNLTLQPRPGI